MSLTLAASPPAEWADDVPGVPIWRLSVGQYHRMIEAGILTEDDPIELLEGWLVVKMSKKPAHRLATRFTRTALERLAPDGWFVDSQEPITTETSEPEPDAALVRGAPEMYRDRHPAAAEVALVVEVADVSLQRDRTVKKRVYASAAIPVYWIVSLPESRLEVHDEPTGPTEAPDYGRVRHYGLKDEVPVVIEGREVGRIPVRELLP